MPAKPDQMLSHYRLIEKIGKGGMGVVFRAEDTTLRRHVALKFLTENAFAQVQLRARFLREARLAAALNHPGICTIHEVGEVQRDQEHALGDELRLVSGTPFIVMELVEGRTLESVIKASRALPLEELLKISVQLAEALSVAHSKGIVHRDLKPGNVMLTPDGRIKILDFGLAKPLESDEAGDEALTAAASESEELTLEGRVLGTVAYMSPEQAMGRKLDSRSDVFSFGIMLYEIAAGHRPFQGDSSTSTMAKILETEPRPLEGSRDDLPPELSRIVRRCLRKKPDDRYNDTRDLVVALNDLREETTSSAVRVVDTTERHLQASTSEVAAVKDSGRRRWRRLALWTTVGAALVICAGLVIWQFRNTGTDRRPGAPEFRQITFTGTAYDAALSPDGHSVAYVERPAGEAQKLIVQDLGGGQPLEILQGEFVVWPLWAPDGTSLLTAVYDGAEWTTLVLPRLGGTARHRLPNAVPPATWSPDGKRIAGTAPATKAVFIIDLETVESYTKIEVEGDYTWEGYIAWSPRGDLILLSTWSENGTSTIWTIHADGTRQSEVIEADHPIYSPRWSPRGNAIYYLACRGETDDLMKMEVDTKTGKGRGEPAALLTGLRSHDFGTSGQGDALVLSVSNDRSQLWLLELQEGRPGIVKARKQLTSGTLRPDDPDLSPDGRTVAYVASDNLFVLELDDGTVRQLTYQDAGDYNPVWSPDGRRIAFGSNEGGGPRVCQVDLYDGARRCFENTRFSLDLAWNPGQRILYQRPGNRNFHLLDTETEEETPLVDDESVGWIFSPVFSPDESRVVVSWNRSWKGHDGDQVGQGLWLIDVEDLSQHRIPGEPYEPVAWSSDGAWIYAWDQEASPPRAVKIPSAGGDAETVFEFPFEEQDGNCVMGSDELRWVCLVSESNSDIWLVEKFDPDLD